MANSSNVKLLAWIAVFATPLFFSTNIAFGKNVVSTIPPFLLGFIRWSSVALILLPFILSARTQVQAFMTQHTKRWFILGFLGMFVCGGVFYWALSFTTAVNGALIYSTTPVWAILIQFIWFKRKIMLWECMGIAVAFLGVCYIILGGDLERLLRLQFNFGDILALFCAVAWALYAIFQKHQAVNQMPTFVMLGLVSAAGAIMMAPFALYELIYGTEFQLKTSTILNVGGIIFFASLLAFSGVQFSIKHLGPTVNVLSLYLLPMYGSLLAVIFLGEKFYTYHLVGTILVLSGVFMATYLAKQKSSQPALKNE